MIDQFKAPFFLNYYSGPQLAICAVGAGTLLNALTLYPGAARVVYSIVCPYNEEATKEYLHNAVDCVSYDPEDLHTYNLNPIKFPAVSVEHLDALVLATGANRSFDAVEIRKVVITGAVTSQRYRRGKNHAYVYIEGVGKFYLELKKLSADEHASMSLEQLSKVRMEEDLNVSNFVLYQLMLHNDPDHPIKIPGMTMKKLSSITKLPERKDVKVIANV